jgi:hypothetical protein
MIAAIGTAKGLSGPAVWDMISAVLNSYERITDANALKTIMILRQGSYSKDEKHGKS